MPAGLLVQSGADLLSKNLAVRLPSALAVLTAVFGMGTGGTPPLSAPKIFANCTEKNFQCQTSKRRVIKVSGRLVPVSFTPCSASTPGLSTW